MRLFESLLIALSTYSAVPVPQFDWNEKNMRYAICFFPAVGVLCGAALWLWAVLAQATGMSGVLFAAIAACLPILVTGGIHMDGFMDTSDALASWQSPEKRLEILKDSHVGAFAVLGCAGYLLLDAALLSELPTTLAPAAAHGGRAARGQCPRLGTPDPRGCSMLLRRRHSGGC